MPRIIPEGIRKEIRKLYNEGLITQYREHLARQRINPETGNLFKSNTQYLDYLARQRIDPETGELFESRNKYNKYLAMQRKGRRVNIEIRKLIQTGLKELGKTQSWLAIQLDVSRQMISFYGQGISVPKVGRLEKLRSILDPNRRKGESLDDLVEE